MAEKTVKIIIAADVASTLAGMRAVEQGLANINQQGQQATQTTTPFADKLRAGLAVVGVQAGFEGVVAGF